VTLADLATALRELPVISIRKYAYEHGFAFFWRSLKLANADFDFWCDEIERLIQEFKAAALRRHEARPDRRPQISPDDLFRYGSTRSTGIESRIKARLGEVFRDWCAARGLAPENPIPMLGAAE
jgi:hypothetical protein